MPKAAKVFSGTSSRYREMALPTSANPSEVANIPK